MSTAADLSASEALANEMAAALAGTFPRERIGQLEPCEQVARGVFALMKKRVAAFERECAKTHPGFIYHPSAVQREEVRIAVLTECLATWQACTMEASIDRWCSEHPRRRVEFEAGYCTLTDEHGEHYYGGPRDAPSLALASALENFDTREDEDGE